MLQKKDIEKVRKLFSSNNYVMTTDELTASKIYYADIKYLLNEELIERVKRSLYGTSFMTLTSKSLKNVMQKYVFLYFSFFTADKNTVLAEYVHKK